MKILYKAVSPCGFKANGISCGIKKSGKPDLALILSQLPAKVSVKFTTNKITAAPIEADKQYLKKDSLRRAILVNSGNANCFTGKKGVNDAFKSAQVLAKALKIKEESVLLASTGIIGKHLPLNKITKAIPELIAGLAPEGIAKVNPAIMTTDTCRKEITARFNSATTRVTVCGMAKGAGMIAPHMATLLVFILTDASISQEALDSALTSAVDNSFNCITVDGCMSTNDTVMLFANGASGNNLIKGGKDLENFQKALNTVCLELAKMIVRDAEGGTKFIEIKVKKARNVQEAKQAALAVANSNLFKTAIYGENPNFGRIAQAVGASGIDIKEKDLKVKLGPLNKKDIKIEVSLSRGNSQVTVYTSDLTPEYVKINAQYS